MIILSVDPGNVETGFVVYKLPEGNSRKYNEGVIAKFGKWENEKVIQLLEHNHKSIAKVYIEMISGYGQVVGATVYDTCVYIGEIIRMCKILKVPFLKVFRKTIVTHLLDTPKGNDAAVRQWCIDTFGDKGTKKNPGVLYGFSGSDMFSALAIACYGADEIRGFIK